MNPPGETPQQPPLRIPPVRQGYRSATAGAARPRRPAPRPPVRKRAAAYMAPAFAPRARVRQESLGALPPPRAARPAPAPAGDDGAAAAAAWVRYVHVSGDPYWHNAATGESRWTEPKPAPPAPAPAALAPSARRPVDGGVGGNEPAKPAAAAAADSSSSDDDSSSDDEPAKPAAKAADSSDDSSDSDSSDDDEPAKPAAAAASSSDDSSSDDDDDDAPVAKKAKTEASASASGGEEVDRTVYLKGLPWSADESSVTAWMASCGSVERVELPIGADGRASGAAFVVFSNDGEAEAGLEKNGETFPDSERWIKVLRGQHGRREWDDAGKPNDDNVTSIFIGNLSWTVEESHVRECFANCGEIQSVRFSTDRETGEFRGFGHVDFDTPDAATAAVALAGAFVDNRAIRVDYAKPKPPRESWGGGGGGGYSSPGGGRGGGRGGGKGGGRGGGRGGGKGTGGGRGRGKGGGDTLRRGSGAIATSTGKKTTFD